MSLRDRWLPIALSAAFVALMCGIAQVTGLTEVLFPEMAAILCGAWILPHQAWNVSRPRMLVLMGAGAVFGILLNLYVPGSLWVRALLGYLFCAIAMNVAGADMSPMVSAAILPVLLGTTSWTYPAAVVVMVGLVCAGQVVLEHVGMREPIRFKPLRDSMVRTLSYWGRRSVVFAVLSAPAYLTGNVLFAVPPLLVAFTTFSRPDFTLRLRPWRGVGVLVLAAVTGACCRLLADAGVPLATCGLLGFVILVGIWAGFATWLPPAGAVMLLALLIPGIDPLMYALEVSAGALIWVVAAMFCFPGLRPAFAPRKA
ncbi:MAG: hypothetical protein PHR15_05440 [Atopobiaceae bacterium]|jgi:hypothetical protein|nr:hypothetical protein [Atopobiaceae bacterium]MCH4214887.1 hypothetical protein [Atopobiaceae bacterium]MCH4229324.1 hypothetical protein [Atopobiaceae bacterium]MCH4276379.1 hypothetical protein [Atopobiaceae bacterium]MCI1227319.1 hypothetical protein [Atopobiaceae bacterium]